VARTVWETIASGREWKGEFHNRRKNGELYWEQASISPVRNGCGEITHLIAVKEDITEHRQIQQALRESEERFRQLFHEHHAVMLLVDPDSGDIVDSNASAAKYYGYSLDRLRTMRIDEINALPCDIVKAERFRIRAEEQCTLIRSTALMVHDSREEARAYT
jgi:PAS domain-containing protein